MRLPIFIVGGDDIFVIAKTARVSYFEPADIESNEYRAWDYDGRPLSFRVAKAPRRGMLRSREVEVPVLEDVFGAEANDAELDEAILARLPAYGFGGEVEGRRGQALRDFVREHIEPL